MIEDSDDLKFMLVLPSHLRFYVILTITSSPIQLNCQWLCRSALCVFKRRVAYANANFDRILFSN